ncbi:MgtC/SapB family protein [Methylotenera sp.]|uniref:MgtC/SapB family protein n=1 Tax=Methylotenera sp. TaxID=2051956 RepID=UPI002486DB93|nr:MgtC/SapB family protein [Methylotenera sp.]MDI1362943.1 MgtC/SapB family protein [Methylotenera sp.]
MIDNSLWLNLAVSLGIGLLVGAERERSKGIDPDRSLAGIRTFTIASLLGAVSTTINFWLLVVAVLSVTVFAAISYAMRVNKHPGLTTEITLIFTVILGGLALSAPSLAASLAVTASILLAAKEPIHGFVRGAVTKDELNDFLILAAATLIVLPLVPNEFIGPFNAINPRNLWLIVILVMFISALGHLALRLLGGRIGLPIVGLVSGFISSIATIGAMGARAKEMPTLIGSAVAGALLSSLSTVLQLTLLLAAIHRPTLQALAVPLIFGGVSIAIYGLVVTLNSFHHNGAEMTKPTRSFSVKTALILATVIAVVLIASAALKAWFGQAGLVVASAVAGLADVHASTISVASLAAAGNLSAVNAVIPILVAFSVNALSKVVAAIVSGGKAFALQVIPGLVIQVTAMWLGWWLF